MQMDDKELTARAEALTRQRTADHELKMIEDEIAEIQGDLKMILQRLDNARANLKETN